MLRLRPRSAVEISRPDRRIAQGSLARRAPRSVRSDARDRRKRRSARSAIPGARMLDQMEALALLFGAAGRMPRHQILIRPIDFASPIERLILIEALA